MGYYTDKILANYICQLQRQKTPRLYPGGADSGPFWWEIWAENDPTLHLSSVAHIITILQRHVRSLDILFWSSRPWCFSGPDSWECFVKTNESWDNGWKTQENRLRSLWWNVLDYSNLYLQGENIRYFLFSIWIIQLSSKIFLPRGDNLLEERPGRRRAMPGQFECFE